MKKLKLVLVTLFCLLPLSNAYGVVDLTVFDGEYVRGTGAPFEDVRVFTAIEGPARIILTNGGIEDGTYEKVSSSVVQVNSQEVFISSSLNQNINSLEDEIYLREGENEISVLLKSKPNGRVRIEIIQNIEADAARVIGPEGDTIDSGVDVILEVPPGALTSNRVITVSSVPEGKISNDGLIHNESLLGVIDFKPDGLVFDKPVTVTFPLSAYVNPGEKLPLFTYDETEEEMIRTEFFCSVNSDGFSCTGDLAHFSFWSPFKETITKELWKIRDDYAFYKGNQFQGDYAWFWDGDYRLPNDVRDSVNGVYILWDPDIFPLGGWKTGKKTPAVRLYSSIQEDDISEEIKQKEPVLFVHGYMCKTKKFFGVICGNDDFGGGYKTWGKFAELIEEVDGGNKFLAFEFQWKTNARFEDVAEDLYYAVEKISEKMGNQKVHLVAHSFGGALARVMLQEIFPNGSTWDASNLVASLTTLGTPHSGIADELTTLHEVKLPQGQDNLSFEGADQLSVHQMGENIIGIGQCDDDKWKFAFIECEAGEIAAELTKLQDHPLPDDLRVQIGIGLPVKHFSPPDDLLFQYGDGLISYEGQRFLPALTITTTGEISPLLDGPYENIKQIKEIVLGYEEADPHPEDSEYCEDEDTCYALDGNKGYYHNSMTDKKILNKENLEAFVNCDSADSCNHASFLNVKEWLADDNDIITFELPYGGSSSDYGQSVQQTSDDGFIIAGYTRSYGAGGFESDVYLIKTDAEGNEIWSNTFGGSSPESGYSVQQTSDGGFIIGAGGSDVYLIKIDSAGNEIWSNTFGGSSYESGYSVQQTSDGSFIVAGNTNSYGAGGSDVYLIKIDSAGNEIWSNTFGGSSNDSGYSVQQTSDGGFIIAGSTRSYRATNNSDVYLIKTDSAGNEIWSNTFGDSSSSDSGYSVQQTSDGSFIIAGNTNSYDARNSDVYLIKTDAAGNEIWSNTFGGSSYESGRSVQLTPDGGFIIAGNTRSYGAGGADVYLIKTDAEGNEIWSNTFGGSSSDYGQSVQQTSDDGFIIAGYTYSYGAGSSDVYLVKTDSEGNVQ